MGARTANFETSVATDALDEGAIAAAEVVAPYIEKLERMSIENRERWWSGFMIAANAMVSESAGMDVALQIARACCELTAEEIDDARGKAPG